MVDKRPAIAHFSWIIVPYHRTEPFFAWAQIEKAANWVFEAHSGILNIELALCKVQIAVGNLYKKCEIPEHSSILILLLLIRDPVKRHFGSGIFLIFGGHFANGGESSRYICSVQMHKAVKWSPINVGRIHLHAVSSEFDLISAFVDWFAKEWAAKGSMQLNCIIDLSGISHNLCVGRHAYERVSIRSIDIFE